MLFGFAKLYLRPKESPLLIVAKNIPGMKCKRLENASNLKLIIAPRQCPYIENNPLFRKFP